MFFTESPDAGRNRKVLIEALKTLHTKYDIEIMIFYDEQCHAILDEIPQDVKVTLRQLPNQKVLRFCSRIPYLSKYYFDKALGKKKYNYLITLRPSVIQACFSSVAKNKIYWSHNDFYKEYIAEKLPFKMKIKRSILKMIYRKYDMVWTVSEIIKNEIKDGMRLNNVYALPNPINCADIQKRSNETRELTFDKSKTNIVMLGRLSGEKGFYRVIRFMCNGVLSQYPNTHLYIIGASGARERYEQYIQKNGYSNKTCEGVCGTFGGDAGWVC